MIKYSITYQVISPESVEIGEFEDQGFEIQDAFLDDFRDLVNLIKNKGFFGFSCYPIQVYKGCWLCTVSPENDYTNGFETYYNLHLENINVLRHLVYYMKKHNLFI